MLRSYSVIEKKLTNFTELIVINIHQIDEGSLNFMVNILIVTCDFMHMELEKRKRMRAKQESDSSKTP